MQFCERILTKCSNSSPVGKSVLPAVLGVVDHQLLGVHTLPANEHNSNPSPCKATTPPLMAHITQLMSPTKGAFCSSASPARTAVAARLPMSPVRGPPAKRSLMAQQHSVNSSSHDSLLTHAHAHHQQIGLSPAPAAPAAAALVAEDLTAPVHPAKRLEVVQGSASKPCQPVTPAISQPQPLAASTGPVHQATRLQAVPTPASTAAHGATAPELHMLPSTSSTAPTATTTPSAAAAADGASASAAVSSAVVCDAGGAHPSPHKLPSPMAILWEPPALEDAAPATQHHHSSRAQHKQQQQQQQYRHQPSHLMSGRKLAAQYDIPLDPSYLDAYEDYQPTLGSGRLDVIVGPMFAGKTTALLHRVSEVVDSRPFIAVKSDKDKRYAEYFACTHGGGCVRCLIAGSLAEFKAHLGPRWHKLQVIAIDEGQFFPDLVEFCTEAVDHYGKHVIVAGLSGDFKRRRFGEILDLLPLADNVTKLTSQCSMCGGKHGAGLFSLRIVQGGPQEVVGGDDLYKAACRRCYLEHGGTLQ